MINKILNQILITLTFTYLFAFPAYPDDNINTNIKNIVDETIAPMMREEGIAGMAVGIVTKAGSYIFNYGVMSKETEKSVTDETLFEIGSISKTFTATLATYATVTGSIALTDKVSTHLPRLKGTNFDNVTLLNLGTYTPGGMPLQFPDEIANNDQMYNYYKTWIPDYKPGTYRTYANPSIGLLGVVTAQAMKKDFKTLMQDTLYPLLGLKNTYLEVPNEKWQHYAQGYTKTDEPIRMAPGILDMEANGIRTTAADLNRFLEANMGEVAIDEDLQLALYNTHIGYYELGALTQGLVWEQYANPIKWDDLVFGNSPQVAYNPNAVKEIIPPRPPQKNVWINKTGSTNGFGAYIVFIPEYEVGIVLLANKNYPMEARLKAAYTILTGLES